MINGQRFPPVPILVLGHFRDKLAAECRRDVRVLCADRFVVTRIISFDWQSVATPAPTPTPTAFPDPPPSGLFDPRDPQRCAGDVEYAFVGWTTTDDLQLPFHRDGHVWAAITGKPVLLGDDWTTDPNTGEIYRVWGRLICIAEESAPDVTLFGAVPGTEFRELAKGTAEPLDSE